MSQTPMPTSLVVIGVIGAPHGVRGAVRVNTALAEPMHLKKYDVVHLQNGNILKIKTVRPDKGTMVVVQFEDVDTRDAAQALTLKTIAVAREAFPEVAEDEFYHADLIGLQARDEHGAAHGEVVAVHNFGAGDILEIRDSGRSFMVGFTKALVPQVVLATQTLTLSAAALLQDNETESSEG